MVESLGGESFLSYAVACANGKVDVHGQLLRRTDVKQAITQAATLDAKGCGPHKVMTATVSRSSWVEFTGAHLDPDAGMTEPLRFYCPACSSAPGHPCINLAKRRHRGVLEPTRWPHGARTAIWEADFKRKILESVSTGVANLELKVRCPVCPPGAFAVYAATLPDTWSCQHCGCVWDYEGKHGAAAPDGDG